MIILKNLNMSHTKILLLALSVFFALSFATMKFLDFDQMSLDKEKDIEKEEFIIDL